MSHSLFSNIWFEDLWILAMGEVHHIVIAYSEHILHLGGYYPLSVAIHSAPWFFKRPFYYSVCQLPPRDEKYGKTSEFYENDPISVLHLLYSEFPGQKPWCVEYIMMNMVFCKFMDDDFSRNIVVREGKSISRVMSALVRIKYCSFHDGSDIV